MKKNFTHFPKAWQTHKEDGHTRNIYKKTVIYFFLTP